MDCSTLLAETRVKQVSTENHLCDLKAKVVISQYRLSEIMKSLETGRPRKQRNVRCLEERLERRS